MIGLGGGSALDLAKGVRLLTGHDGPLAQYTLVAGGLARIHGRICPLIAIPTTAGTGSEVGRAAVIITAEGRKLGIISPHMLPSIALCDPELTYGLPPGLTAATGMDAISHCLETFMAPAFNPPADAIAHGRPGARLALDRGAVRDGADTAARNDMMMCALEGATGLPEGARRRSRAHPSARRHPPAEPAPRHAQRGADAGRAALQPRRHRPEVGSAPPPSSARRRTWRWRSSTAPRHAGGP